MFKLSGRDLWALAMLTVLWGVNWPVMKAGVRDLSPMTFRSLSMIGGLVVLAIPTVLLAAGWARALTRKA